MTWLNKVLLEHSTSRYFVEYRQFFSNHISHGIIALERLGATEARVRQWIKWYSASKLEEPSGADHTDEHVDDAPLRQEELDGSTGKRKRFYAILNHYAKKLADDCNGDVDALLKKEFPPLALGLQASLLHGIIQLGYGYAVKDTKITLEGLAYLRHSYVPIVFQADSASNDIKKFGNGDTDIVNVLYELKQDDEIYDHLVKREPELRASEWISSGIQYKIFAICEKGDKLIGYVNKIKVPRDVLSDPILIADWVLDQIITVYAMAQEDRQNDFVLLHGITCAWSLRQIVPLLNADDAVEALRYLVVIILAAYLVVGGPRLTIPVDPTIQVDATAWQELIKRTIVPEVERDEHVYKLIQVCHELWQKAESGPNSALYFTAAKAAVDNPFASILPTKLRL